MKSPSLTFLYITRHSQHERKTSGFFILRLYSKYKFRLVKNNPADKIPEVYTI